DVNSPEIEAHAETTLSVLHGLGADEKKIITVFNKIDDLWSEDIRLTLSFRYPEALFVSAHSGEGIPELLERIEAIVESDFAQLHLLIPHDRYDLVARLHREGGVRKEEARDDGTYIVGSVPERMLSALHPFLLSNEES
ncbi:MAG: hypothetical protein QMB33_05695, partial [Opitutales bacterium]